MALAEGDFVKDLEQPSQSGDVILGDDWVAPRSTSAQVAPPKRKRGGIFALRTSPLARKIVTFNLIALAIMVLGILYSDSAQNTLELQRKASLANEARLVSGILKGQLPAEGLASVAASEQAELDRTLDLIELSRGSEVFVFSTDGDLVARSIGTSDTARPDTLDDLAGDTFLTDWMGKIWNTLSAPLSVFSGDVQPLPVQLRPWVVQAAAQNAGFNTQLDSEGGMRLAAGAPVEVAGSIAGVVTLTSAEAEIDKLVSAEREGVLRMFLIATLVSIGLSLVLASTIANPLADLSAAAELGRDKNTRNVNPGRVRIPDLTARPDEIGRLSGALRSMVAALYTRIEGNEQFAADVAHEIKNPLASLRSAVGTLRMIKREDQREKLLDVIDHDVRRLDRLVSDISNASRLDSELVKEEEEPFNLLKMLDNLGQYLGEDAQGKGIDFILDLPSNPVVIHGLEARLAQVFVNLITNAISFCEDGDAIRVWARKRQNRVLVVVEDTGPGIPDQALSKIFKRFYSQRPEEHFGNNSGLGLAISKQIVEAHGGVIWAENIRPTDADITSDPLGARFVVGLPV